jgi:hypothetical protein
LGKVSHQGKIKIDLDNQQAEQEKEKRGEAIGC